MYSYLERLNSKPPLFSASTAEKLWTDPHLARQMLSFHLDPESELASRSHAFIQRSVHWLADTFHLSGGGRVLDLGCGPGLYANALAGLGARVTGVDFSDSSLAHARTAAQELGVQVEYLHGDYLKAHLEGAFDLVLLIFGDFCPLSPDQRRILLSRISSWMAPGGRFVFDVTSLSHFRSVEETSGYEWFPRGGFWSPGPHFLLTNRFTYPGEGAYLDRFTVLQADSQREFFNWIQCFSPETLEAELAEAGWAVDAFLGNLAGDPFDPEETFFGVVGAPS